MKFSQFAKMFNCKRNSLERYNCKDCNFKSNLMIFLMQHRLHCHPIKADEINETPTLKPILRSYPCKNCNNFETNSLLHFLRHSEAGCSMFKYDYYPFKFQHKNNLRTGLRKRSLNHSPQWYQCPHCSFKTQYKGGLKTHIGKIHSTDRPEWNQCSLCSFKTQYKHNLRNHIRIMHSLNQTAEWFECPHCPFKTYHKYKVKYHIDRMHLPARLEWFECSHCSYKTNYMNDLRIHNIKRHSSDHSVERYQCPYCPLKTKYNPNLRKHIKAMHLSDRSKKSFQCSHCSYNSKCEENYRKHLKRIHSLPCTPLSFECPHCNFKAVGKGILKKHIQKEHSKSDGKFYVEPSVTKHGKSIAGIYNCGINNLKNYQCKDCNFKTNFMIFLKQHRSRNHGETVQETENSRIDAILKSYTCNRCDFQTNSTLHLLRHSKTCKNRNNETSFTLQKPSKT